MGRGSNLPEALLGPKITDIGYIVQMEQGHGGRGESGFLGKATAMRGTRQSLKLTAVILSALTLGLGVALAPAQQPDDPAKAETKPTLRKGRVGLRAPVGRAKALRKGVDPLNNAPAPPVANNGEGGLFDERPIHYSFRISGAGNSPLNAVYYPSKLGTSASPVLLIHEKSRSLRDFQEPITELKKVNLAEYLQAEGFAVLAFDLSAHGANPRKELNERGWRAMTEDVQAAYRFLLDRHNRGELNLARMGIIGIGEGANLATVWASLPGAGVSSEGRTGDIAALILISPMSDDVSQGLRAGATLAALAQLVPIQILSGERDVSSKELVASVRPVIERSRVNKVELYPTSLHGYKLVWLEPGAVLTAAKFLESTTKFKVDEWEPRYNLNPVLYSDSIQVQGGPRTARPANAPAAKKAEEPALKKAEEPAVKKAEEPAPKR